MRVGRMADAAVFLQSIAVGELQAQKQRLDIYTVQARFAHWPRSTTWAATTRQEVSE